MADAIVKDPTVYATGRYPAVAILDGPFSSANIMSDLSELASQHCRPLQDEKDRLAPEVIAKVMPELPGWQVDETDKALIKTFMFSDYYHTMAFVNALAYVAHRENHHPDLGVYYNRCVVRFSTHDADGITNNDLISAAKAECLALESTD
jgi:4a-hydroxytetrahydrobiopterin dehydratase